MLIVLLNYCFLKKQDSKRDLLGLIGFRNFKVIFTLLAKVIVL